MKTTHDHFAFLKPYWTEAFKGIKTFKEFRAKVPELAKTILADAVKPTNTGTWYCYDPLANRWVGKDGVDRLKQAIYTKVEGDTFEIFTEFFLQYYNHDKENKFGAKPKTYKCVGDEEDLGLDGVYKLNNGEYASVQVKWRTNPKDKPFDKNVFCSLFALAISGGYFDIHNPNSRLVFVTNNKIGKRDWQEPSTSQFMKLVEKYDKQTILLGEETFVSYADGNEDFWNKFADIQ